MNTKTSKSKKFWLRLLPISFCLVLTLGITTVGCANNQQNQANQSNNSAKTELTEQQKNQPATNIILLRHGQTDYNVADRLQGHTDIPLNSTGISQAEALATYLKDVKIDVYISSPLSRAKVTGEKVAASHGATIAKTDDRLKEIDYGDWTGWYKKDLKEQKADDWKQWEEHPESWKMPNGESAEELGTRGAAALQDYANEYAGKTVLVAAHSLLNQATLCKILGLGFDHFYDFAQDNTSFSVFRYEKGKWTLLTWNDIPHTGKVAKDIPLK